MNPNTLKIDCRNFGEKNVKFKIFGYYVKMSDKNLKLKVIEIKKRFKYSHITVKKISGNGMPRGISISGIMAKSEFAKNLIRDLFEWTDVGQMTLSQLLM